MLEALLAQPVKVLKEIIIVDSSDDGLTPALLDASSSERVRILHLAKKTIPAVARNLGAAQTSGDILAFIDSDSCAAPDWISRILEAYARGCRAGGGAILLPEFQTEFPVAVVQYFLQSNEYMPVGSCREVLFTPGCNIFCEKELFLKVGGFPEIRAAEDVLFGLAVRKIEKYWFDPSIRVSHIYRTEKASLISTQKLLGRYVLIYRRRYHGGWMYRGMLPIVLLPGFILVKFFRIVGRILFAGDVRVIGRFLTTFPLFVLGLWYWSVGFFQGCLDEGL
jgi:glycosyltransferase involved in cell wall biosynthesis